MITWLFWIGLVILGLLVYRGLIWLEDFVFESKIIEDADENSHLPE